MGEIQQSSTMKIYLATALLLFVLHAATADVETPENELVFDVAENDVMAEDTFAEEEEDVADSDTEDEEAAERRGSRRKKNCRKKCKTSYCRSKCQRKG